MKISLAWLSDFVDFLEKDPPKIAEVLTEKSAEIEKISDLKKDFEKVVVGEIVEILPHPNADKIRITKTKVSDDEILQIVCGAKNIKVGQKVPVAKIGAVLPGDFKIEKRKMRGVESRGMLCSGRELGISDDHAGIFILKKNAKIGEAVAKLLGKDDTIFEVENTSITNRPDLFSHIGFAREAVACGLAKWRKNPPFDFSEIQKEIPDADLKFDFQIENPELCPARGEIVVEDVAPVESPPKIKNYLENCGIRAINAIVDISNFVMLETGMPLHTFDAEKIGAKITMRASKKGEKMRTLDGIERELPAGAIIQSDENGIFDLAGIMGGENSGISDSTNKILIHVPIYDPVRIRRAALALNHRTDAATIYEKGVPKSSVKIGLFRTLELLKEIFPEMKIVSKAVFVDEFPENDRTIKIEKSEIRGRIGREISAAEIADILQKLDFHIQKEVGGVLEIKVPPHRFGDIKIPADIVEEIARISGLNAIPAAPPTIKMAANFLPPAKKLRREIADFFVSQTFFEVLNLAFLGEELLKKCGFQKSEKTIEIQNPLGADQNLMRENLFPRMLKNVAENRKHREKFRLFEIGKVFEKKGDRAAEKTRLAAIAVGEDFFVGKGLLAALFERFGFSFSLKKTDRQNPLAKNAVEILAEKKPVGELFVFSKKIAEKFDFPENSAGISLDLDAILKIPRREKTAKSLPKFPAIELDLSVLADEKTFVEEILKPLKNLDSRIFSAEILEIFSGKNVPAGKKSVTIHFEFRAPDRTLTDDDEKELREKILKKLEKAGFPFRF